MAFASNVVEEPVLQVKDITVKFGGFTALKDVNLALERGELRVIIGPNGAGKTTLLDVITGKVKPRCGQILFQPHDAFPHDVTTMQQQVIARLGIGRKFQTPNVFKT